MDLLLDQPVIALLVVLALGLLVGQLKVRGVMLGMLGIFLVGMPVGYLGFRPPPMVATLGAILLLYGVGLGAGPTFFRSFGTYGKPLRDLTLVTELGCRVLRVLEDDRLRPVPFEWRTQLGSHVLVLGPADALPTVTDYLGRPSEATAAGSWTWTISRPRSC